ncbi:MAG: hypothetical protein KDD40_02245 [Bdellovibrionales bacterium]|nr:hypothetical protein [Bdellovibrionales bacterium]
MKIYLVYGIILLSFVACSSKNKKMDQSEMATKSENLVDSKSTGSEKAQQALNNVECKIKKDIRFLKVVAKEPKGCELIYTKFGKEKTVAESAFGNEHCEKIMQKMQGNLESAGFKCQ